MKSTRALTVLAAAALLLAGAPPLTEAGAAGCATTWAPIGDPLTDCARGGTVLNILPPGANGLTNTAQFLAMEAGQNTRAHTVDQYGMYAGLARVAPQLQAQDLGRYFKSAQFGVPQSAIERTETPGPGTVILRDRQFGVPHIYGQTRYATEFGAGYAAAEDRLFMMDVFRHVGRATLSSFLGISPTTLALDCSTAQVAGYSEAEFQAQVGRAVAALSQPVGENGLTEGQQILADANAYTDGVNEYINESLRDPSKLPAEYPALQQVPAPWKVTDIAAVATLVQAIFATGGGNEVASTLLRAKLRQRFGLDRGTAIWSDLRSQNDPGAPTTLTQAFPYQTVAGNPASVAVPSSLPDAGGFCDGGPIPAGNGGTGVITVGPVSVDLSFILQGKLPEASNAILVGAGATAGHRPIAVFGPQVSYYNPQILHEMDIHGPGIDARGASFPGTDVYVELGRGVDYAWSATSAGADIIDQRAEKLCNTDGTPATLKSTAYLYDGRCVPMYERTDRQVAKPTATAQGAGVVTIQIERSVHGPIVGRTYATDAGGTSYPVAIAVQRSTFADELGAVGAFYKWNNPNFIHSAIDFQKAAGEETGTFNWFYIDNKDIAYYMSGRLPVRAAGADPSLLTWGDKRWDWTGTVPVDLSAADVHPRAVNPPAGFMTNWNNKPAPQFSASDSNFGYGPVHRVQSLYDRVRLLVGRGGVHAVDVVNAMEDAATVDLDGSQIVGPLQQLLDGTALTAEQTRVLNSLASWAGQGAHRRDRKAAGAYEMGTAVAVMDGLYGRLAHAIFDAWLDPSTYSLLAGAIMGPVDLPGPKGSAYDGGWEGYLQRALRQAANPAIANGYSQNYCGSGSKAACQQLVTAALQGTIDALTRAYGSSDPATWTCARSNSRSGQCNPARDDIVFNTLGVASVPNIPWQNRPTFQQVVQYTEHR